MRSFAFDSLDKLSLHNTSEDAGAIDIVDALRMELNLFAGQLYLESYLAAALAQGSGRPADKK